MKKVLAIILVMVMMLSVLAACSPNTSDPGSGTDATPTPGATNTPAPSGGGEDPEPTEREIDPELAERLFGWRSGFDNHGLPYDPITLTVNIPQSSLRHVGPLTTISASMIEEATGVILDFIGSDNEVFAIRAAGGDMTDIIILDTDQPTIVADLISVGTLLDMEPMLGQYGKYINEAYGGVSLNWVKNWVSSWTDREGVYFLPKDIVNVGDFRSITEFGNGNGFYTRLDIYEAVGMPPITDANGFNEDLLLGALKMMQDYARDEMGISNAYALAGFNDWGSTAFIVDWMYQYGIMGQSSLQTYASQITGEFTGPMHETDFYRWDIYRFFNKAFRMGIFDPESFILPFGEYFDRINRSEILSGGFSWMFDFPPVAFEDDRIGNGFIKGMPYIDGLFLQNQPIGQGIGQARAINANSDHIERAMAVLDYVSSGAFIRDSDKIGLYGVHWNYDDQGRPQMTEENAARFAGEEWALELFGVGLRYDYGMYGEVRGVMERLHNDGFPTDIRLAPYYQAENFVPRPSATFLMDLWGAGSDIIFPGQLYAQWVDQGIMKTNANFADIAFIQFAPAPSEELAGIAARVNSLIEDRQAELVMAASEDAFNAALERLCADILALGEDRVHADALTRMEEGKAVAARIVG